MDFHLVDTQMVHMTMDTDMDMAHIRLVPATTTPIFIPKVEEDTVVEEDILVPVLVLTQVIEVVEIDG
jgi:hypothetical protein